MTIFFYSPREKPYGCFSNFSAHGFLADETWSFQCLTHHVEIWYT